MEIQQQNAVRSIYKGDQEELKNILEQGLDVNAALPTPPPASTENLLPEGRTTLLHVACNMGALESARVILDVGAEINIQNLGGCTALHLAYDNNKVEIVEELLARGADSTICDQVGRMPGDCFYAGQQTDDGNLLTAEEAWTMNILYAVSCRYKARLRFLLSEATEAEVNCKSPNGMTPLLTCSLKGDIEVMEILLDHGAKSDITSPSGRTALHFAVQGGHADLAERLLKSGVDADVADQEGLTPLMLACLSGRKDIAELLTKSSSSPLTKKTCKGGQSALHFAGRGGHTDLVEYLLTMEGYTVNDATDEGMTVLMVAAASGHISLVELLLGKGADQEAQMTGGMHSGKKAGEFFAEGSAEEKCSAIRKLLGRPNPLDDPAVRLELRSKSLFQYCQMGDMNAIRSLIEAGADVNFTAPTGLTPLHVAAIHEHPSLVPELLKKGADPNACGKDGLTPLHIAVCRGYSQTVCELVDYGADIDQQDSDGMTAFHFACQRGSEDIATYLESKGADVRIPDKHGNLPGDCFLQSLSEEQILKIRAIVAKESTEAVQETAKDAQVPETEVVQSTDGDGQAPESSDNKAKSAPTKKGEKSDPSSVSWGMAGKVALGASIAAGALFLSKKR